ncbi:HAD-IIB family hydrolase [Loktanella agnita]|uniref:HAD-IIB family hydrolase n=1 Tax=Loktanella agnita TaxID=287097 RepID=UPI003989658B
MTAKPPLLVFTDLDGTLIDHDSYQWDAAQPALRRLHDIGAGVVLASSKTAVEIGTLRDEMGLRHWPAIVENGAGLLPANSAPTGSASSYDALRDVLAKLPGALRDGFHGFGDMSVTGVADITGLPIEAAKRAKMRQFSEPGLWQGDAEARRDFLAALADHGVTGREGGRFLTLSFGNTKADQIDALIAKYHPTQTLSLGDAPNDVEMLQATDHGVIVANPHRPPLPPIKGEAEGKITRTNLPGPTGWNQAVLDHVNALTLT